VPAAAVIPAPIVYIKVVAVKKLVVECRVFSAGVSFRRQFFGALDLVLPTTFLFLIKQSWGAGKFYCE
jgi:hypothetical protein